EGPRGETAGRCRRGQIVQHAGPEIHEEVKRGSKLNDIRKETDLRIDSHAATVQSASGSPRVVSGHRARAGRKCCAAVARAQAGQIAGCFAIEYAGAGEPTQRAVGGEKR